MIKKILIYLFAATALFAYLLPAQELDGPLVVMDRQYYEYSRDSFYANCRYLGNSVDSFCEYATTELDSITNNFDRIFYWATLINANTHRITNQELANDFENWAGNILSLTSRGFSTATSLKSALDSWHETMQEVIEVTSNTFPIDVSSTNLTLVVVVSNTFQMASNEMEKAQNVYTNFLNYYRGIEDWMLDQYRATQTNLLNWSNFPYWLDYSLWFRPSYVSDSWHTETFNFAFWGIPWNAVNGWGTVFNAGATVVANWKNFAQRLNDNANYVDWLAFNLQGIHDSAEYGTRAILQMQQLFNYASTCTVMSVAFTSSSQTNALAQFLQAPDTYGAQLSKISKTRNWFQRIEHWLSAIARNTYRDDKTEEGEEADTSSDFNEAFDSVSNQVGITSMQLDDSFQSLGSLTNATAGVQSLVDSLSTVLDSFKSTSSGNRSGEVAPPNFKLMSTDFIQTTFARSNLHTDDTLPDFIGCQSQDTTFGYMREGAIWIHHFFGIIWIASALALFVFYMVWLSSWVVTLWYRMLGFVAKLTKFTFGAS